jgi:hypothetical protein
MPSVGAQAIHYFWLWPNTVVYSAPGPPNMSVLQFIPLSSSRSLRRAHRFFAPAVEAGTAAEAEKEDGSEDAVMEAKRKAAVRYLNEVTWDRPFRPCCTQCILAALHCQRRTRPSAGRKGYGVWAQTRARLGAFPPAEIQHTCRTTGCIQHAPGVRLSVHNRLEPVLEQVLLAEDTALCESIQHGLSSRGYSQGRFVVSPNDGWETERSVAHFHALCHASLMGQLPGATPAGAPPAE